MSVSPFVVYQVRQMGASIAGHVVRSMHVTSLPVWAGHLSTGLPVAAGMQSSYYPCAGRTTH